MAVTTEDEPTGLMRFITGGGNPAQLSYETLARRRAIAAALAAKQRAFPKTLGEGMTYLGEALGEARNDRASDAMERTLGAREAAQRGALPTPSSGLIGGGGAAVAPPVAGAPMAAGAPAAGLPPVNAGQPSPLPPGPVGPLAAGPPPEEANPQRARLATLIARLRGDEPPAGQEAPPANPTEGAVMPPQADLLSASTASPGPSGQQLAALGGTGVMSDAPPPGAGVPPLVEENPETPSNIMPAPVRLAQAGGVIPGSVAPPVPASGVLSPPGGGLLSGVPSTGGPPPGAPSTRPIPDLKEQTMEPPGAEPVRPGIPPPTAAMKYVFPLIDNPRVSPEQRAWAERVFKAEQAHQTATHAQQQETYKDQRELWQSKTKEYEKFQREKHDRLVDQTIKLHGIEETQTKLEDAYFKRGIPRQQAVEKADLEIKEAQRRLTTKPTKEIKGVIWEYTDPTPSSPGGWAVAPGSPKEADNLTETQAKTVKFLQRATVARSQLGDANVLAGLVDTAKGKVPIGGNYAVSPAYQRAYSAANTWVSSVLRDESGALIGDKERHAKILEYFPQPGDSEQVMRDKAFRRRAEEESLYNSLGDRKKVMDEWRTSRTSRVVPRGPDGQQIYPEGTERVNKKTGARQRVMGGHWENEEDLR